MRYLCWRGVTWAYRERADSLTDDQWIQDLPYILAGIQQTMRQIEALK